MTPYAIRYGIALNEEVYFIIIMVMGYLLIRNHLNRDSSRVFRFSDANIFWDAIRNLKIYNSVTIT